MSLVVNEDNQSPTDRAFVDGMMVVAFGRKGLMCFDSNLSPASRTSIDPGHGRVRGRSVIRVENITLEYFHVGVVLVPSHVCSFAAPMLTPNVRDR